MCDISKLRPTIHDKEALGPCYQHGPERTGEVVTLSTSRPHRRKRIADISSFRNSQLTR